MPANEIDEAKPFRWVSYDLRPFLPNSWQSGLLDLAQSSASNKVLTPTSTTSRESDTRMQIPVHTVGGKTLAKKASWLYEMYQGLFRELAQTFTSEAVHCAQDVRYALNLNVQRGDAERYECHVDSNPVEGLLYVTSHSQGSGGELVVSNQGSIFGIAEVERNATRIYPVAGHFILFDARRHSHYVAPLNDKGGIRMVVAMNFYTPSCPESARPADLNAHLGLD